MIPFSEQAAKLMYELIVVSGEGESPEANNVKLQLREELIEECMDSRRYGFEFAINMVGAKSRVATRLAAERRELGRSELERQELEEIELKAKNIATREFKKIMQLKPRTKVDCKDQDDTSKDDNHTRGGISKGAPRKRKREEDMDEKHEELKKLTRKSKKVAGKPNGNDRKKAAPLGKHGAKSICRPS